MNAESIIHLLNDHEHNFNAAIVRCAEVFGSNSRTEVELNGTTYTVSLKTENEKNVLYFQYDKTFKDGSSLTVTERMQASFDEDNEGDTTGLAHRTVSGIRQILGNNERIKRSIPSFKALERAKYYIELERGWIKLVRELADKVGKEVEDFFS